MKSILLVAVQLMRHLKYDKSALIWMLLVPCLYIFIFGNVFRSSSDPTKYRASLSILNQDTGFLGERLFNGISSENIRIDTLNTMPEKMPRRLLVIPPHFTDSLLAAKTVILDYQKKSDLDIEANQAADLAVQKSMYRLLADMTELNINNKRIRTASLQKLDIKESVIILNAYYAGEYKSPPSGFYHQVPGNIVQFTLILLLMYAGGSVLQERKNGVLRRIFTSPIHLGQLYWGKMLGILGIGFVQVGLLLIVGRFAFGIYYGQAVPALILLLTAFCLAVASIGLCLGFLIKNNEKLNGICIISGLSMAAISGCWWPIEIAPGWMQKLAMILPSGMALGGMHQLISFGKSGLSVLPNILGLLGITVVFSLIFIKFMRKLQPDI